MLKNRKFVITIILYAFCGGLLWALPNLILDPQHLFRKEFGVPLATEPNLHFKKMEFIMNNKNKYDSFIFGSSTLGVIDPSHIPIGRFYNLYYPLSVPLEYLNDLRIMLKEGVKIKYLIIGLEDIAYKINPRWHLNEWVRHPYDDSKFKRAVFLLKYLFSPVGAQREAYWNVLRDIKTGYVYDIARKGNCIWDEDYIFRAGNYSSPEKRFTLLRYFDDVGRVNKALQEIKEIVRIAKTNRIKLIVFINPIYRAQYFIINPAYFSDFKKGLAQITDYYDFSGLNSVTNNKDYFYEGSHYRPLTGDLIISRIFNINTGQAPPDFGVLVTKDNVDQHIVNQKNEIKARPASKDYYNS